MPQFGGTGPKTHYLMLGLSYLPGVSRKEMLATVAHEYAYVYGNHGKPAAHID
jgi:hypothetical protein